MLAFIFAVLLALMMLLAISLDKTYQHITGKEIKRQARLGNQRAKQFYKSTSYDASLQVFLSLVIVLTAAGSFVLFTTTLPAWLSFILIGIILSMGFWWLPEAEISSPGSRLALWCAAPIGRLLYYLHPFLQKLGKLVQHPASSSTGVYEKEDMLEFLDRQKQQPDNRIPPAEIDVAKHALGFGDKTVQDISVPRRNVHIVSAEESIGPILIDELHKTGHSRFPVYEGKRDHIIGTLYLRDLINLKQGGKVSEAMRPDVSYVHEEFSLHQALQAFLHTKHQLFIVVNNAEEFVGIITIEDVLKQALGKPMAQAFDQYENPEAVATSLTKKEEPQVQETDDAPASDQLPADVVE